MYPITRGEYWIESCNQVIFADGDIGDFNHEAYFLSVLRSSVLGYFDIETDCDQVPDFLEALTEKFGPEANAVFSQGPEALIEKYIGLSSDHDEEYGEILDQLHLLMRNKDTKGRRFDTYAIEEWKWCYVRGDCYVLPTKDAKRLYSVVSEVLEAEGITDEDLMEKLPSAAEQQEGVEIPAFVVTFHDTGETISYSILDFLNQSHLPAAEFLPRYFPPKRIHRIPLGPSAQLLRLDHESQPAFYRRDNKPFLPSD